MPTKRQWDWFDPCSKGSWREIEEFPKIDLSRKNMPECPQFGGEKPGKYAAKSRPKQKNAGKYAALKSLYPVLQLSFCY